MNAPWQARAGVRRTLRTRPRSGRQRKGEVKREEAGGTVRHAVDSKKVKNKVIGKKSSILLTHLDFEIIGNNRRLEKPPNGSEKTEVLDTAGGGGPQ